MIWFKTKNESLKKGYLHIARDINKMGSKEFTHVKTYEEISKIIDENDCIYEVVTGKWTEFYDFDGINIDYDKEDEIVENFKFVYSKINPNNKVHYKVCKGDNKLSIHFVIPNSILNDCYSMRERFMELVNIKELKYKSYYDNAIYTKDRLIRTVRSDKVFSNRIFSSQSEDKDLFVSHVLNELNINTNNTKMNSNYLLLKKYGLHHSFVLDAEMRDNTFRLRRINPSNCIICNRIHDKENAYININDMSYGCFRDLSVKMYLEIDTINVNVNKLKNILSNQYNISNEEIEYILSRCSDE